MPLKLLKHKSWHVGKRENIERVRRDEAAEQARIEADEQRMQEEDARNRLALLRGRQPPAVTQTDPIHEEHADPSLTGTSKRTRKPRKRDDMVELDAQLQGKQIDPEVSDDAEKFTAGKCPPLGTAPPVSDFKFQQPWYVTRSEESEKKKARLDAARKQSSDPLVAMQAFLAQKKALEQQRVAELITDEASHIQDSSIKTKREARRRRHHHRDSSHKPRHD
ncbi:hypothetical protein BCR37DRAFT_391255 [Protomyces lactucae-debilis]|uniref:CBF1-interacting co-repressor CIR N-terminal domain-containing protein n=1 Tax=Protomyces lactucae-debilis TaxID=2754530 RepID=A0A1Y2FQJ2_PROLT|nr:uncharacterized protein BCR37DRAFT_391255 [Protomyces lactucae-debilis]ORY85476.1 hypothetical protein BCR37DRAFT_391255 [Protomyces lactucae-debilis]